MLYEVITQGQEPWAFGQEVEDIARAGKGRAATSPDDVTAADAMGACTGVILPFPTCRDSDGTAAVV